VADDVRQGRRTTTDRADEHGRRCDLGRCSVRQRLWGGRYAGERHGSRRVMSPVIMTQSSLGDHKLRWGDSLNTSTSTCGATYPCPFSTKSNTISSFFQRYVAPQFHEPRGGDGAKERCREVGAHVGAFHVLTSWPTPVCKALHNTRGHRMLEPQP
jgi:hypothetical protein